MKLLPKNPSARTSRSTPANRWATASTRPSSSSLFFGLGFLLDRLLGTTPMFMIVMTILGAVGVFVRFWYRYDAKMTEHEAVRSEKPPPRPLPGGRSADDDVRPDRRH